MCPYSALVLKQGIVILVLYHSVCLCELSFLAVMTNPSFPAAYVLGGAVEGVGEPREHSGGPSCRRPAGEELSHVKGPRRESTVSAEMAGHRRQRSPRDQELCKRVPYIYTHM